MSGMWMRCLISPSTAASSRLGHGDADDLAAGLFEAVDLGDGRLEVVRVGRGHRLHPDRVVAADDHVADPDFAGLVPLERVLISHPVPRRKEITGAAEARVDCGHGSLPATVPSSQRGRRPWPRLELHPPGHSMTPSGPVTDCRFFNAATVFLEAATALGTVWGQRFGFSFPSKG